MHTSSKDLFDLEKKTLKQIYQVSEFARLGDIHGQAQSAANTIRPNGVIDIHLSFLIAGGLRADRRLSRKRRFDVSATVTPISTRISTASYAVIICDGEDPATSAVLRKFHFDFESYDGRNLEEAKPTTHLQICGKFSQHHLDNLNYTEQKIAHWFPEFEKPRIPIAPTSLALVLNWIFLEFQAVQEVSILLRNPRWKSMVYEAEQTILKPYYESASKFLSSAANSNKSFFSDHLYERA
jgi:hypothetical protein